MLVAYPHQTPAQETLHPEAVWIDLLHPTDDEARLVAAATGLHVPTRAELAEIESSSRLRRQGEVFTLSLPTAAPMAAPAPVGFVLSRAHLITVRFNDLPAFDAYLRDAAPEQVKASSMDTFLGLLEAIVDRMADVLEREAAVLETASHRIFRQDDVAGRHSRHADRAMRALLREIGSAGDVTGRIRETLLGLGRIAQFVEGGAGDWLQPAQRAALDTMRADIASLVDYHTNLSDKVQFLLDATLGFINIDQNNIIKVLTIVSIVGIPPTFIASLYGMNFHDIPELNWSFGYWYAWGMMILTGGLPLVWFWVRGWL